MSVTTTNQRILLIGYGYIGSYLYEALMKDEYGVNVCDLKDGPAITYPCDYAYLDWDLRDYDTVLFFAGSSSVTDAEHDPQRALEQNCLNLARLRKRMRPDARLIYASSGSLYSHQTNTTPPWALETDPIGPGLNAYDRSKACMDHITEGFLNNTIGLRLGTVCGYSPRLRPELLFNAMCLSAIRKGIVKVANPMTWRSILFLDDLYQVVRTLIEVKTLPGCILNVASSAYTIEQLGFHIAKCFDAEIQLLPSSPTYNFRMNNSKMYTLLGQGWENYKCDDTDIPLDIYERCRILARAFVQG